MGAPQIAPFPGSIAASVRGTNPRTGVPPYIALQRMQTGDGPAYLGVGCSPFEATGLGRDNLSLNADVDVDRIGDRRQLLRALDTLRRDVDAAGTMEGLDTVEQQAFDLILGKQARDAYDLSQEDPRTVERYGKGLGSRLLTARRLCEAGTSFVTVEWSGTAKFSGWDNHSGVFKFLRGNVPDLDRAVTAFVEDGAQRGLSKRILLVVMGEMGRTPKINGRAGRDHWPQVMFSTLSGGGLKMGQVVGQSSARGEEPKAPPFHAQDLLATLYHVLGIDLELHFTDNAGRPVPIITDGRPIAPLL